MLQANQVSSEPARKGFSYTKAEEKFITENFRTLGAATVAQKLGRTEDSITIKFYDILKKKSNRKVNLNANVVQNLQKVTKVEKGMLPSRIFINLASLTISQVNQLTAKLDKLKVKYTSAV